VKSPQSEKPKRKQINRILWVDDNPENNAYQIANLRSEGFEIRQVLSTDEALGMLLSGRFKADAIISDMGRKERGRFYPTAGLQLIRTARESNIQIPIFVYTTGQSVDKYEYEVEKAGGNGITSSPVELSQMIYTWA
jgi:CheY-like chemotaxis protein